MQEAQFHRVIGAIYDAVLDETAWQGALAEAIVVAKLPHESAQALLGAYDALAGDTDSGEFIFLYADKSGEVKALKHPHGFAFAHEGQAACTTPARPVLVIPVRVKLAL